MCYLHFSLFVHLLTKFSNSQRVSQSLIGSTVALSVNNEEWVYPLILDCLELVHAAGIFTL